MTVWAGALHFMPFGIGAAFRYDGCPVPTSILLGVYVLNVGRVPQETTILSSRDSQSFDFAFWLQSWRSHKSRPDQPQHFYNRGL